MAAARAKYAADIDFWQAVQYLFYTQWHDLKAYANAQGIEIIGDLPIYVAEDSVDVWSCPQEFQLDENLVPTEVAGCPPDGFSATGQLWGNPLFDWDAMAANGYAWWVRRIRHLCGIYDVLRIDHFRGFAGYYAIPYGDKTAENGRWRTGPGYALFAAVKKELGSPRIIAEDLGFLPLTAVTAVTTAPTATPPTALLTLAPMIMSRWTAGLKPLCRTILSAPSST